MSETSLIKHVGAPAASEVIRSRERIFSVVLLVGLICAGSLFLAIQLRMMNRPYDAERFTSGSAHFSTITRTYATEGFWTLKGLPIGNNPPQGTEPDAYIHWPPLFDMLMAPFFRYLGATEAVAHGFVLVIFSGLAAGLFWLVNFVRGRNAATAAVFALLVLPICFQFSRLVQPTTLCILLYLLAAATFLKGTTCKSLTGRRRLLSGALIVLAVATSWEAVFMPAGLILASWLYRDRPRLRLALVLQGLAVTTVILVLGFYLAVMPQLSQDLWHTFLYRAHIKASYQVSALTPVHSIIDKNIYEVSPGIVQLIKAFLSDVWGDLGCIAILSVAFLAITLLRRGNQLREAGFAFAALGSPLVLWYSLLSIQARFNGFELLMAGPLVGLAFGVVVDSFLGETPHQGRIQPKMVMLLLVPVLLFMLLPAYSYARKTWRPPTPTGLLEYSRDIQRSTPPTAVVLSPDVGLVPAFYSHRHIIRGIFNDSDVAAVLQQTPRVFPDAPVYLALKGTEHEHFEISCAHYPIVFKTDHLTLLHLQGQDRPTSAASAGQ